MKKIDRFNISSIFFWKLIGAISLIIILLLYLAPTEKSMGQGIKIVYIHVALMISGKIGILLSGFLGLFVLYRGNRSLHATGETILFVAIYFFSVGILMSIIAMKVNWGAIFWSEPRMKISSAVIAIAIIIQVVKGWFFFPRLHGVLNLLLALFLIWQMRVTPLLMHPTDPVGESDSFTIRLTFLAFITLFCVAEGVIILFKRYREII